MRHVEGHVWYQAPGYLRIELFSNCPDVVQHRLPTLRAARERCSTKPLSRATVALPKVARCTCGLARPPRSPSSTKR
jgi:hypothetical protein